MFFLLLYPVGERGTRRHKAEIDKKERKKEEEEISVSDRARGEGGQAGEGRGEAGDSVRREKGKKFPWQTDDEQRLTGDEADEGKTRAKGSAPDYYVKRTWLFSSCVPRSFILYSKALRINIALRDNGGRPRLQHSAYCARPFGGMSTNKGAHANSYTRAAR